MKARQNPAEAEFLCRPRSGVIITCPRFTALPQVFVWGHNRFGQLGTGSTDRKMTPVLLDTLSGLKDIVITTVSCGGFHTAMLSDDGRVYVWGQSCYGQLGLQDPTTPHSPLTPHTPVVRSSSYGVPRTPSYGGVGGVLEIRGEPGFKNGVYVAPSGPAKKMGLHVKDQLEPALLRGVRLLMSFHCQRVDEWTMSPSEAHKSFMHPRH